MFSEDLAKRDQMESMLTDERRRAREAAAARVPSATVEANDPAGSPAESRSVFSDGGAQSGQPAAGPRGDARTAGLA